MADSIPFYIGTYTHGASKGIYRSALDLETGMCAKATLAVETDHPSFLAIHPHKEYLYAVNETGAGSVSAFARQADGSLTHLNTQASHGGAPCHLVIDATGNHVLVANYSGGSITSLPIQKDGLLGEATATVQHTGASVNPRRQQEPHAHSINLTVDNRYALVADLGLDKVLSYPFDAEKGTFGPSPHIGLTAPGAGPRHVAIHGRRVYAINELLNTIDLFHLEPSDGNLTPMQSISTLPPSYHGRSHTAEVVLSSDGQFVYGSNRGHDSIAVFRVTDGDGQLDLVEIVPTQGKSPRNFVIDPSGQFLLAENQGSDTVTVFRRDAKTGTLVALKDQLKVANPVCIRFLG